jgi:hypothetical protein
MPPAGFELTIAASEQSKTHALNRADTKIGNVFRYQFKIKGGY